MTTSASRNPVPFNPEANPNGYMDGFCDTDTTGLKFRYTWIIKYFSYLIKTTGEFIESPSFGGREDVSNWCLHLFPKGLYPKNYDFVSLYLIHIPEDESDQVIAKHEFCILNCKLQKANIRTERAWHTFKAGARALGYADYIRREDLLDNSNGLMHDQDPQELVVCCEIEMFDAREMSDGRDDARWFHYSCKFRVTCDLERLHDSQHLSDIALIMPTEDKKLLAHKAILAARSPLFAAMFRKDTQRVVINDMAFNVLQELVRFIYTGKIPVVDERMTMQLLGAADKYGLNDLKWSCEQELSANISAEKILELLNLAKLHNARLLMNGIVEFMKYRASDDVINGLWAGILREHPELVSRAFKNHVEQASEQSSFSGQSMVV